MVSLLWTLKGYLLAGARPFSTHATFFGKLTFLTP